MPRPLTPRAEALETRALLSTLIAETEPNSKPRQADVVELGDQPVILQGRTRSGDRDLSVIQVANTGTTTLDFQAGGRRPVKLMIREIGTGKPVFNGMVRGGPQSVTLDTTAGSAYLVRVVGVRPQRTAYRMEISQPRVAPGGTVVIPTTPPTIPTTPPTVPTTPPTSSTIVLDSSGQAEVSGTLATMTSEDAYTFTAPRSGRLNLSASQGASPVVVEVLDATGTSKLTIYSDLPNFISFVDVVAGQAYTIKVTPRTVAPASYIVSLSLA